MRRTNVVAPFFALLFVLPLLAQAAPPATGPLMPAGQLPVAACCGSVVWDGTGAYVFAGHDVIRYDASTGAASLAGTLPASRVWMQGAWLAGAAYLFGGGEGSWGAYSSSRAIERFDPATGAFTRVGTAAGYKLAVAAIDDVAYVFSGKNVETFDARTNTITPLGPLLAEPVGEGGSAVWTGSEIVLFPGTAGDRIITFDPVTLSSRASGTPLGLRLVHAPAVWDGAYAYAVAGDMRQYTSPNGWRSDKVAGFLRYDPAADDVVWMAAALPTRRDGVMAVWSGDAALVFGGRSGSSGLNEIHQYTPVADGVNTPPVAMLAQPIGVECREPFAFDASASTDAEGDSLDATWSADGLGYARGPLTMELEFPAGTHTLHARVWDQKQWDDTAVTFTVEDTQQPTASPLPAPVAGTGRAFALGAVDVGAAASDACGSLTVAIRVPSIGREVVRTSAPYTLHVAAPALGTVRDLVVNVTVTDAAGHSVQLEYVVTQVGAR